MYFGRQSGCRLLRHEAAHTAALVGISVLLSTARGLRLAILVGTAENSSKNCGSLSGGVLLSWIFGWNPVRAGRDTDDHCSFPCSSHQLKLRAGQLRPHSQS